MAKFIKRLFLVVFILLISTILATTLLLSCKEVAPAEEAEEAAPAEEAEETTEVTEKASFEGREITLWISWGEGATMTTFYEDMAEDYKSATGATVNVVNVPISQQEVYRPAILEGNVPDICETHISWAYDYAISEGTVLEISDIFEEKAWDKDVEFESIFWEGALDQWPLEEGSRYYVPSQSLTSGIFYNKTDFDARGFEVPKTWDEFIPICEAYKADGIAPFSQDGGVNFYNFFFGYWFCQRVAGPGTLYDASKDPSAELWDDPKLLEAFDWVYRISPSGDLDYFIDDFSGYTWPGGQADWAAGKGAFLNNSACIINETSSIVSADFVYGFFPFPEVTGGRGSINGAESRTFGFFIPKDSENVDVAKDFIKFALTDKYQIKLMDIPWLPAVKGLEDKLSEDNRFYEALSAMIEMNDNATEVFEVYDKTQGPWFDTVLMPLQDQVIFGKITAEEFIEKIKEDQVEWYK